MGTVPRKMRVSLVTSLITITLFLAMVRGKHFLIKTKDTPKDTTNNDYQNNNNQGPPYTFDCTAVKDRCGNFVPGTCFPGEQSFCFGCITEQEFAYCFCGAPLNNNTVGPCMDEFRSGHMVPKCKFGFFCLDSGRGPCVCNHG